MAMWRSPWRWLLVAAIQSAAVVALNPGMQIHNVGPNQNSYSMPVTYSMAAPSITNNQFSGAAATPHRAGGNRKSAVLQHFKTVQRTTTPTPVEPDPVTKYSSSYNSQHVQLPANTNYPVNPEDEHSLLQKQQSYQNFEEYQKRYHSMVNGKVHEQPARQNYQYSSAKQSYPQVMAESHKEKEYGTFQKVSNDAKSELDSFQSSPKNDVSHQQKISQQDYKNYQKQQMQQQQQEYHKQDDSNTQSPGVLPNVLSYQNAQTQVQSPPPSKNDSAVPNALSIEEAVAAAAAVTESTFTPEQQQLLLQQQILHQQILLQQQQELIVKHQMQLEQQRQTTASYEKFYEAAAATGMKADSRINTTPRSYNRYKNHQHKLSKLPYNKYHKLSPLIAQYYASAYPAYAGRVPYRRVTGTYPHLRTGLHKTHPHTHGPQVQHFFHGPYTMESGLPESEPSQNWIEQAISPVKRDDTLLSGLGAPAGSSTALLNGLLVPIVLLGLSLPALGFAYSYLNKRSFGGRVDQFIDNLQPSEESMEYYLRLLEHAMECYHDPKLHDC